MLELFRPALALAPALAPWALLVALIVVVAKAWQPFQAMRDRKEESEVVRLNERVKHLEAQVADLLAQVGVMRHAWSNESASFDALLLIAKTAPEKLPAVIPEIERQRNQRRLELAAEKGAIAGARIAAAEAADPN